MFDSCVKRQYGIKLEQNLLYAVQITVVPFPKLASLMANIATKLQQMCLRIQDMNKLQEKELKAYAEKSPVGHSSYVTGQDHFGPSGSLVIAFTYYKYQFTSEASPFTQGVPPLTPRAV